MIQDRYTKPTPKLWVYNKTCPSCHAENQPYLIHSGDDQVCPKCYVPEPKMGLGERTDMYLREGDITEDDAFRQAKEDLS